MLSGCPPKILVQLFSDKEFVPISCGNTIFPKNQSNRRISFGRQGLIEPSTSALAFSYVSTVFNMKAKIEKFLGNKLMTNKSLFIFTIFPLFELLKILREN